MSVEVIGLPTVLAGFASKLAEIQAATGPALVEGAATIKEAWVANIESEGLVLTGNYRDSVHVDVSGDGVAVKSDVPYGPILEYGDSRQAAHPVAQRAFDENHENALERIADRMRGIIG